MELSFWSLFPDLKHVAEIVRSHHEEFDGNGYPQGLKGDEIPVAARIITVANSYHSLTSKMTYGDGMPCRTSTTRTRQRRRQTVGSQLCASAHSGDYVQENTGCSLEFSTRTNRSPFLERKRDPMYPKLVQLKKRRFIALILAVLSATSLGFSRLPIVSAQTTSALLRINALQASLHIQIETTHESFPAHNNYGEIDGADPDSTALANYLPIFPHGIFLYPAKCIQRSELKKVILCQKLRFAGQERAAVPDYTHDALYLDTSRATWSPSYMRKALHHEFFHIIDWKDDGHVYEDDSWSALNATGFKYGAHGINAQDDSSMSLLADNLPGFLTKYSTTGVEEDKAELFANMMVDYPMVAARAKKDPILNAKFLRMKELLKSFCPSMDNAFWTKSGQRGAATKYTVSHCREIDSHPCCGSRLDDWSSSSRIPCPRQRIRLVRSCVSWLKSQVR